MRLTAYRLAALPSLFVVLVVANRLALLIDARSVTKHKIGVSICASLHSVNNSSSAKCCCE